MVELYSRKEAEKLTRRARRGGWLAAVSLTAGLAVCVALCFRVNTLNALALQWITVGVSALAGWTAILLLGLCVAPARAEAKHVGWMLDGEREACVGRVTVCPERLSIPRSIAIQKVRVTDGEQETVLNVYARKAALLPRDGRRARVVTVRRYIVAWEACDENA